MFNLSGENENLQLGLVCEVASVAAAQHTYTHAIYSFTGVIFNLNKSIKKLLTTHQNDLICRHEINLFKQSPY